MFDFYPNPLQSVGESSVSSESAASARGTSPSRSDDSRSISPLPPPVKYKTNNTSSSVISNSSGSSGSNSTLNKISNSTMSTKPKKRAAPLPPSTPTTPISSVPPPVPHKPLSHSLSNTEEVKPTPRRKDGGNIKPSMLLKQNSMTAINMRNSDNHTSASSSVLSDRLD